MNDSSRVMQVCRLDLWISPVFDELVCSEASLALQVLAHQGEDPRTLAALSEHLPAANIEVTVQFMKPVLLPSEVRLLASAGGSSGELQLLGSGELQHMLGNWQPIA